MSVSVHIVDLYDVAVYHCLINIYAFFVGVMFALFFVFSFLCMHTYENERNKGEK